MNIGIKGMSLNKKALFVIFMTVFIDLVGFGIIIPLSPYLSREFGADAFDVGLLMMIYSLMQFIFSPFWGQLSDRFGRRPIILLSLLVASLSHLGFAFANSFWMLFMARMFAGIGGANISTAMAYIADVTCKEDRSKGMGLIGAAFGLGFVIGPFMGGYFGELGQQLGDAPPFGKSFSAVVASGICLLNFLIATFSLKESLNISDESRKAVSLLERVHLIFGFIVKPVLGKFLFTIFLFTLAVANMEAVLFLLVDDVFHLSLKSASYGFAFIGLIMVFTQGYLIRKWMPKFGESKLLRGGLLLSVIGFFGIALSKDVYTLGVFVSILAVGMGLVNPSLSGSVSLCANSQEQGSVMGVYQSLSALGRIFGPLIGGIIYLEIGQRMPFWVAAGLVISTLFIVLDALKKSKELRKK